MKRSFNIKFFCLVFIVLFLCLESPLFAAGKKQKKSDKAKNSVKTEKVEKSEKTVKPEKNDARFDDWKYKGFGKELPEWIEAAVDGKEKEVLRKINLEGLEEIQIFTASGINVDQSEEKLKNQLKEIQLPGEKKLIEAFWVRVNQNKNEVEEPYITVLIYEK